MNIFILKQELDVLLKNFANFCLTNHLKIVTAESCTAGLISAYLTDLPGSSAYVEGGFVTYSNIMKQTLLGVSEKNLIEFGAVSEQVAKEMAQGALQRSPLANISVAVTGIAGPNGESQYNPVGLVWIAAQTNNQQQIIRKYIFSGNREAIRLQTVIKAIQLLQEIV